MGGIALLQPGAYVASDMMAVIVAMLKSDTFIADTGMIQTFFWRMRRIMPILQGVMNFSTTGPFPFSRDLEDALNILYGSRIIVMTADFKKYVIRETGRAVVEDHIRALFTDEELKQLGEIAGAFAQEQPLL